MVKAQRVAASLSLECVELTDKLVSPKEFSFAFLIEILPMSVCADMSFEGCCMKCEQSSFFHSTWRHQDPDQTVLVRWTWAFTHT